MGTVRYGAGRPERGEILESVGGTMEDGKLRQLVDLGEGQRVEFKSGIRETSAGIESLAAFRNAGGGTVVFGVRDDGTVVGVAVGANTLEQLANQIPDHTDPHVYPVIATEVLDGRLLIVVTVEEDRGRGVTYAYGKALIRVGSTNRRMSSAEETRRHQHAGGWDWNRHGSR